MILISCTLCLLAEGLEQGVTLESTWRRLIHMGMTHDLVWSVGGALRGVGPVLGKCGCGARLRKAGTVFNGYPGVPIEKEDPMT